MTIECPVEADRRVQSRLRRARTWLGVTQFVHGSTFMLVLLTAAGGSLRSTAAAVIAAALAAGPLVVLLWWERRTPSSHRPARWLRRGSAIGLPHAVAFGIAAAALTDGGGSPSWPRVALFAGGLLVVELMALGLASRALCHPLSAELGGLDVEVLAKIRPAAGDKPAWLANDEVLLTGDELITTVRPGFTWAFVERIELGAVIDVEVRATTRKDGPWFEAEGQMFWPAAGDAVVITHRSGTRLLPVYDPHGFAEVVRARISSAGEGGER